MEWSGGWDEGIRSLRLLWFFSLSSVALGGMKCVHMITSTGDGMVEEMRSRYPRLGSFFVKKDETPLLCHASCSTRARLSVSEAVKSAGLTPDEKRATSHDQLS